MFHGQTLKGSEFDAAVAAIGGLSNPDKMPCYSWSTPAIHCRLGSLLALRAGSTCSDCYARKGTYLFASTRDAMARRWGILQRALSDDAARTEWVGAFASVLNTLHARTLRVIARTGSPGVNDGRVFRWHDSGDVQSVGHLAMLVDVAILCPDVRFWLPTRETGMVRDFIAAGGIIPRNLTVRLSVPMRNAAAHGLIASLSALDRVTHSGVHDEAPAAGTQSCVAYTQEGHCRDCRACWDPGVAISYPRH